MYCGSGTRMSTPRACTYRVLYVVLCRVGGCFATAGQTGEPSCYALRAERKKKKINFYYLFLFSYLFHNTRTIATMYYIYCSARVGDKEKKIRGCRSLCAHT
jgi:hypothetical protein